MKTLRALKLSFTNNILSRAPSFTQVLHTGHHSACTSSHSFCWLPSNSAGWASSPSSRLSSCLRFTQAPCVLTTVWPSGRWSHIRVHSRAFASGRPRPLHCGLPSASLATLFALFLLYFNPKHNWSAKVGTAAPRAVPRAPCLSVWTTFRRSAACALPSQLLPISSLRVS